MLLITTVRSAKKCHDITILEGHGCQAASIFSQSFTTQNDGQTWMINVWKGEPLCKKGRSYRHLPFLMLSQSNSGSWMARRDCHLSNLQLWEFKTLTAALRHSRAMKSSGYCTASCAKSRLGITVSSRNRVDTPGIAWDDFTPTRGENSAEWWSKYESRVWFYALIIY